MTTTTDIVNQFDRGNFRLYQSLSDSPKSMEVLVKNIPWMIPQLMTGAINDISHRNLILLFDELCNPVWDGLVEHPELRSKLLTTISIGSVRHKFYRPSVTKHSVDKLFGVLQRVYEDIRVDEVALWCRSSDIDEIEAILNQDGIPLGDRDEICKQYHQLRNLHPH